MTRDIVDRLRKIAEEQEDWAYEWDDSEELFKAADEIERLRKMLEDHGINPDGEYIARSGLRVPAPGDKVDPGF